MSRILLSLGLTLGLAAPALADEVIVFAAASMKTALDQVAADFSRDTGHEVQISYAGSNVLARQIIEGAPAHVFISAAVNWMDEVEKAGLIEDRADLLGNSLVLVAGADAGKPVDLAPGLDLAGMLDGGRLSMALVDAVPAGQYGQAALQHLGLWDSVAPSVAEADNVRAALVLVSRGEAPFGIVYGTDAAADPAVTVVGTFPADSHPPITYPAALLKGATDAERAFHQALSSTAATDIFKGQGFTVLD